MSIVDGLGKNYSFRQFFLFPFLVTALSIAGFRADAQDDTGQPGVTVQQPTLGVSIDAAGVLAAKVFLDPDGTLFAARLKLANETLPANLKQRSAMRKISLRRLDQQLAATIAQGNSATETMANLAGLTSIEYVFIVRNGKDIILAGPAEPWIQNAAAKHVGIFSGLPTVRLTDLIAAFRIFAPEKDLKSWVACSIDPTAQGLQNLKHFQRQLPAQVRPQDQDAAAAQFSQQMRESLGLATVNVYGVNPRTNAAHVMVEADYRMKMMAVGLELPPIAMTTFVGALKGAPKDLQRWWLTPNYKCLRQANDRMSMQLVGRGVRLQTENLVFDSTAKPHRRKRIKPNRAARLYADSFTANYEALAIKLPVFAQLRNVIDCLVAAAWIHGNKGYELAEFQPGVFLDESAYSIDELPVIHHANCVANAVWKQNVLVLPAGGGVSISATEALAEENILKDDGEKVAKAAAANEIPDGDSWWWD